VDLYTFYPCKADGAAVSFETFHLPDDDAARTRAALVLDQHESCACVTVWCGDRLVARRGRDIRSVLRQANPPTGFCG